MALTGTAIICSDPKTGAGLSANKAPSSFLLALSVVTVGIGPVVLRREPAADNLMIGLLILLPLLIVVLTAKSALFVWVCFGFIDCRLGPPPVPVCDCF